MPSLRSTLPRLVILTSLLALAAPSWAADIVNRKSGGRASGKITGGSKTELIVKPGTGDAVHVPANDIAGVEWDDATADVKLGISDENGGRFDSALQRITKSRNEYKGNDELLKLEFEFLVARVTGRQAIADASKREQAVKLLEAFLKSGANHFRYYDAANVLGQVHLAAKDFTAARTSFDVLAQAPWNDVKLAAKIATGRILIGEGKPDEAVAAFDEAIRSAGDAERDKARRYEAMLGKARTLIQQSRPDEALKDLDEVTTKAPADDTPIQAEAYVLQGNALQALNRNKEAVLAYLHVDILFPREAGYHAESLYHMARLWKTVQAPERGLEAEDKLKSAYPNSEWAKRLTATPTTE